MILSSAQYIFPLFLYLVVAYFAKLGTVQQKIKVRTRVTKRMDCAILTYYQYPTPSENDGDCNIGDYIQSLAAKTFCKNPALIDRDALQFYEGRPVRLVANGWYNVKNGNYFCSSDIQPLFIAYHVQPRSQFSHQWTSFFRNLSYPIGARDLSTKKILEFYKIPAYFSACLTLTLGLRYHHNKSLENGRIVFVEVSQQYREKLYKACPYLADLKETFISHSCINNRAEENFQTADKLLTFYSRCSFVVTSRLHVALPCSSIETPVLLMRPSIDSRFEGLLPFVNHWIGDKVNIKTVDGKIVNPVIPLETRLVKKLIKRVRNFVLFGEY